MSQEEEKEPQTLTGYIEVPDGGYGWVVVGAMFLFNISTWASNSAFSIYLAHYLSSNTFAHAQKLDYSAIGGIAFGCGILFNPLILLFKEMTNIKITIIVGGIVQFSGIMLAAFSTKLWQLYLTQGVLIGFGLALINVASTFVLPQWFREKRSMAQALASSGSGAGGVMFNLAMQSIIKTLSVRWALIIQAIICSVCTGVGVILVRTRDSHIKSTFKLWDNKVFFSFAFLVLALYMILTMFGYVVLLYNLADFTRSLGYTASQGSIVSCMVSVGAFFGRPILGKVCDKFGTITSSIFVHSLTGIFCLSIWIPARNLSCAIGFAFISGALMGSIWFALPPIITRLFGLRKLTTASGMAFAFIGASGIASPVIGIKLRGEPPIGKLYSPTQYRNPAIYCGVCYLCSAISLWIMRGYLIARDEIAEENKTHIDSNELDIKIDFTTILKKLFSPSKFRTI